MESPTQGCVQQRNRPVGGVHRADDPHILGDRELRFGVLKPDSLVAVFEQEVQQFAEDLGQIAPIDLVEDQGRVSAQIRSRGLDRRAA